MTTSLPTLDCTGRRFALTGGGGYFGRRLCEHLLRYGAEAVHLFDLRTPVIPTGLSVAQTARVRVFQGDIRERVAVENAFAGCDTVFHIASYGMSGKEQLQSKLIYEINVDGTKIALAAAVACGVRAFVYTSTTNVIFGGRPIINGDETLPYCDLALHTDNYSRTKAIAEQLVLKANSTPCASATAAVASPSSGYNLRSVGARVLKTCALRPAGIYGENEERHFPRIVSYIKAGLFSMTFGAKENRVEFVYVDNLAEAHVLAGNSLVRAAGTDTAAGQAYFISDGEPVNNFEFMRPLVEGLGYKYPKLVLPYSLVYYLAYAIELVHFAVGRVYNFQPLLTRTEVNKTGVTHYFKIDKARRDLGYNPKVTPTEGMARLVRSFVELEERASRRRANAPAGQGSFAVLASVTFAVLAMLLAVLYVYVLLPELQSSASRAV